MHDAFKIDTFIGAMDVLCHGTKACRLAGTIQVEGPKVGCAGGDVGLCLFTGQGLMALIEYEECRQVARQAVTLRAEAVKLDGRGIASQPVV